MSNNNLLAKTFFWMFLGLLGTGIIAAYTYFSELYLKIFTSTSSLAFIAITEVVVVLVIGFLYKKLPPVVAGILFFIYAGLNGFTFSSIFAIYEMGSIVYTFFITAAFYGILAFIGFKTNKDLSSMGIILLVALLVSFVGSIINFFIGSGVIGMVITIATIFIFAFYTVYDMNMLKRMAEDPNLPSEKTAIYLALQLYLDFINLFIRLLAFFGKRKD